MDGSRYPRPGHRIAPLALREILQAPIPDKRFSRKLRLSDLDETTWDRYDVATCRKLAKAVVRQVSAILPLFRKQRHLPKLPPWVTADDILIEPRTYNCLHRRGWLRDPQRLADLTVGELVALGNFGKKCLVDLLTSLESFISWPTQSQPVDQLDASITDEARKLLRMKSVETCTDDDPRFGRLVREIGLDAKNVKDLAQKLIIRSSDPGNPETLVRRLIELRGQLRRASHLALESELNEFTAELGDNRDRQMIVERLGWDGSFPKTLETIGNEFSMTRERVRQICSRVERLSGKKPFAPVLDRAIQAMRAESPAKAEEVEKRLVAMRFTRTLFRLESLLRVADTLGRTQNVTVKTVCKTRFILPLDLAGTPKVIARSARTSVQHWGVATIDDVAAETAQSPLLVRKFVAAFHDFEWLDEANGWFWLRDIPRNALLNQIEKILCVTDRINVSELRTGVSRHHRREGFAPPRRVLLELCRHLPWCQVNGDLIKAEPPLAPDTTLNDSEQIIFRTLKNNGPVLQREKFEELCLRAGLKRNSFFIHLSYSPIITRYAAGVYGLRGTDVPPGLVSSLIPKRRGKRSVILDYSWYGDGKVRILYKLSKAVILNGILSIPSPMKKFLQARFSLKTAEGSNIGVLVVKNSSARGLGPFFRRRGGDPGDYLLVLFDPAKREVEIQIRDADLVDSMELPEREAIGFHWDARRKPSQSGSWDARFQQLVEFKNRNGHCKVFWSTDRSLALWASRQRSARRTSKLDADCIRRLEKIGFPWGSAMTSRHYERVIWELRFQQLAEFRSKNGHCNVPRATDRVLWGWVGRQRRARRIGKVDTDHVHRLEEIGFHWEAAKWSHGGGSSQQSFWEARFQQLVEFKKKHGHCNVPRAIEKSLGQWVSNQRHTKKIGKLSEDRVRKLEGIGFQ